MSNETKLTASNEFWKKNYPHTANELEKEHPVWSECVIRSQVLFADQQTASLQEEIERLKKENEQLKDEVSRRDAQIENQKGTLKSFFNVGSKCFGDTEMFASDLIDSFIKLQSQLSESQKEVKQLTEALEFALGIKELWSANAKYINYSEEHKNEAEALLKMESMFNQLLKKGE